MLHGLGFEAVFYKIPATFAEDGLGQGLGGRCDLFVLGVDVDVSGRADVAVTEHLPSRLQAARLFVDQRSRRGPEEVCVTIR